MLKKVEQLLLQTRAVGHTRLLPFQEGILMSEAFLQGLFTVNEEHGLSYCLTSRLNQDYIENFYSQIRGFGHHYNHPSPVGYKRRFRLSVIGANVMGLYRGLQQLSKLKAITTSFLPVC